ncbi:unnamed protein product, partial [Rotaria sordida]
MTSVLVICPKSKCFVTNEKGNNAIWKNDVSLIGKKDENDIIQLLERWATCNDCYIAYRTHSKSDIDGKWKNFRLNGIDDHLKHCKWKSKVKSTDNQGQNDQTTTSVIQPKFAFHKKGLPEKYKSKLKDAELKFIVGGSHSFNSLENNGLLNLVQTSIEIGANIGSVDVHDNFYGRQTIREEALSNLYQSYDTLLALLRQRGEQHRLLHISPQLLSEI